MVKTIFRETFAEVSTWYKAALEMEDSEGKGRETLSGGGMVSRLDAVDHVNSDTSPWHKR